MDVGVSAQGGNGWTNRQVATLRGGVGNLGYSFSVGHIGESMAFGASMTIITTCPRRRGWTIK